MELTTAEVKAIIDRTAKAAVKESQKKKYHMSEYKKTEYILRNYADLKKAAGDSTLTRKVLDRLDVILLDLQSEPYFKAIENAYGNHVFVYVGVIFKCLRKKVSALRVGLNRVKPGHKFRERLLRLFVEQGKREKLFAHLIHRALWEDVNARKSSKGIRTAYRSGKHGGLQNERRCENFRQKAHRRSYRTEGR